MVSPSICFKDNVKTLQVGGSTIFLLNKNRDFTDCNKNPIFNKRIILFNTFNYFKCENVIKEMKAKKELCDFLCVNLKSVFQEINSDKSNYGKKYKYNFYEYYEDFFPKKGFGFVNPVMDDDELLEVFNEEEAWFLRTITGVFTNNLSRLVGMPINFNKHIYEPFINFLKILNIKPEINTKDIIYLKIKTFRDLFQCWQNSLFFEQLIYHLVKLAMESRKDSFFLEDGAYIIIEDSDYINSALEIDILLINRTNSKIIFIECKNAKLNRNKIYEFIGKCCIVEKIYNIKIDGRIMISSGELGLPFKSICKDVAKIISFYCLDSYKSLYEDFLKEL